MSLGVFSGCFKEAVGIKSIDKTATVGLVDYYTITYTDGTQSFFTVTNGKDGTDAPSTEKLTAEEVYESYKTIYGNELTYADFCQSYLTTESVDNHAALNASLRSCLKVYTVFSERASINTTKEEAYCGSAVIYRMEEDYTYLVTNYHVIYDHDAVGTDKTAKRIYAYMYGSEYKPVKNNSGVYVTDASDKYAISCEYMGGEISYDVAVVKAKTADILKVNPGAVAVTLNTKYAVGDTTYAVGNPDDKGLSVTEGIVSVDSEMMTLDIDKTIRSYRALRTDTALYHGNSGGGLFNINGQLIGLNNAGDSTVTSMNYAIPASILKGVADGIIHYCSGDPDIKGTKKTVLGIKSLSFNSSYVYDQTTGSGKITEDVTVQEVTKNSIAEQFGLQKDDVIKGITVNSATTLVDRQFQIADILLSVREGDSLSLIYKRGEEEVTTETVVVSSASIEEIV